MPSSPLPSAPRDVSDEVLNLEPLLGRLERIEARMELVEQWPAPSRSVEPGNRSAELAEYRALLSDLDRRVDENTRELELLRERVTAAERTMAESVASVRRRIEETREEIPAIVEHSVAVRFDDLRTRLDAEIERAHQRTLATFERVIEEKVSVRIDTIERALGDHAVSIEALRVRAVETDSNLQRLVGAIEKLCERAQFLPSSAEPAAAQTFRSLVPFESQFNEAMEREPVTPVVRGPEPSVVPVKVAPPAFAGSEAPPRKKSRFLFRNSVIAVLGFFGARFLQ